MLDRITAVLLTTKPDGSPPIAVASKQVRGGLAGNVVHLVFLTAQLQIVRVFLVHSRQRTEGHVGVV